MSQAHAENNSSVLIIDDDDLMRQVLKDQLEESGFGVIMASNGQQGLCQLADNDISLVIVDLVMPEMDGVEFCKKVRGMEEFRTLPLILLTGRNDLGDGVNPFQVGADDYLNKPVDPVELVHRIQSHIVKREAYLKLESQARDNETLLEIARSVNSTLDIEEVLKQIVSRVASILDDVFRCSIVFIRKESRVGHVIASSDEQDFAPVEITLEQ